MTTIIAPSIREFSKSVRKEQGAYLATFAILSLVLFTFAGLAIDAGILYRTKIQIQSAADAGTITGLSYRAVHGWSYFHNQTPVQLGIEGDPTREAELEEIVAASVRQNLEANGIVVGDTERIAVNFSSLTDGLTVDIDARQQLYLSGFLFGQLACGLGNFCDVRVTASAQLSPANVALVLDTSGSMRCPIESVEPSPNNPCQCLRASAPNDCNSLFAGQQRIDALKTGVMSFSERFNPNRDRFAVMPFNIVANSSAFSLRDASLHPTTAQPFGANEQRYTNFIDTIAALTPASNTNHCDGLLAALEDVNSVTPAIVGREQFSLVLFTDGAPTAGRFSFADFSGPAGADIEPNDWIHYMIEWRGDDTFSTGPSPIVAKRDVPFNYNFNEGAIPADTVSCGLVETAPERFENAFSCLNSLEFTVPFSDRRAGNFAPWTEPGTEAVHDYIQQYYHCGIEIADRIRELGGNIFAIGLGREAFTGSNDPYQNIHDANSRKDFFLRRVALDRFQTADSDPKFGPRRQVSVNDPEDRRIGSQISVGYVGYVDYSDMPEFQPDQFEGAYYPTESAEELETLFIRIAKSILLRLTN